MRTARYDPIKKYRRYATVKLEKLNPTGVGPCGINEVKAGGFAKLLSRSGNDDINELKNSSNSGDKPALRVPSPMSAL